MKESIIKDMLEISNRISKLPISKTDYKNYGKHAVKTVKKYFGSWAKAIRETFNTNTLQKFTKTKITISCKNCGKNTYNPKFCSSSCSAMYLNKLGVIGKKRKNNYCILCGEKITPRRKKCNNCKNFKVKTQDGYKHITDATIEDVLTNDTQKYRRIRNHARLVAKKNNLLDKCEFCPYNKHVECAHITPIEKFPKDTLIKIVNDLANLKGLCRNCHWEFDNLPR